MAQVNLQQTGTFNPPPTGMLGYGFDLQGNPVRINSNGTYTKLSDLSEGGLDNIVANKGVDLSTNLPSVFVAGDIFVTNDTYKVYTAIDSETWQSADLQESQFVLDIEDSKNNLYQFADGVLRPLEKLSDAPSDGKTYGRKDAAWSEVNDHAGLDNLPWLDSGHISEQTSERIPSFGADGNPDLLKTIEATFYVGDFTGDFAGLATESNWTNNITASVAGTLGDRAIGIGSLGCIYECFYTQYGWARDYINLFITDSTLIASLQTSGNWTKVTDIISYYNASTGDRGQRYYANGYNYECINGTTHTWIRIGALDTVEVTDINYIPKPQIEVGKGIGDIITIPAKYDIISIIAESETTTAGNIIIGRTATAEVSSLAVTSGCTANGNCQVVLDGITFTVALTTAQNTATLVATAIRAASFVSGSQVWTTGGSGTTVTFTSNKYKAATDATYSDNGTGATGTMTTSTQGVDPNNDIVTSTALSTVIGNKKNLTVIKNVDYPTSSTQSIYVNISSAATVKLHIILQKMFE